MLVKRKSIVHGFGIFASRDIKAGSTIFDTVTLISKSNVTDESSRYLYPWSRHYMSFCDSFGAFFNHSDRPNLKIFRIDSNRKTKTFKFLRDIKKGEEIFLDYGKVSFEKKGKTNFRN